MTHSDKLESTQFLNSANKSKYQKNPLLVKPELGKSKRSVYDLPDPQSNFSFGRKNIADKEGAGAVILNWKPSNADEKSRSKQKYINQKSRPNLPDEKLGTDASFGIKTVYGETAKELVTYKYEEDWVKAQKDTESKRKQMAQQRKAKQRKLAEQAALRKAKHAQSSAPAPRQRGKAQSSPRKTPHGTFGQPPQATGLFKMKKFDRVPARLQTRGARDLMRTTNYVVKKKQQQPASRAGSVAPSVASKSQRSASQAASEDYYPEEDASYDAGMDYQDNISVHSSVSQQPSVPDSEASY